MQLAQIDVNGLFGRLSHSIVFPTRPDEGADTGPPSVTILHGPNGVGKTTVLRMLDGIMRLDFDVFRKVPFSDAALHFSTGQTLSVRSTSVEGEQPIAVGFDDHEALLHPDRSGSFRDKDNAPVEAFREHFFSITDGVKLDFIETSRIFPKAEEQEVRWVQTDEGPQPVRPRGHRDLAQRVAKFIREAQVDSRGFFAGREPELFDRIMRRITEPNKFEYDPDEIVAALTKVNKQNELAARLGLTVEPLDLDQLRGYLDGLPQDSTVAAQSLPVVGAYAEMLQARAAQQALLSQRLVQFEEIMQSFYKDKSVSIDGRRGLLIRTRDGTILNEKQLSSGEEHLLYLMVSALTTRRRGTVIAIDEPELSMHIAWQRMLLRELIRCASNASPQLVLATHSPEVVADFQDHLVPMTLS
jgi:energy-coupling factor transporter ATP-binding protein EcfA2